MRCVLNLTNPNSGEVVFYENKKLSDVGLKVGSLIEAPGLYKNATAYENIRLSWEKNGLVHICSLDAMMDVPNEELEGVEVFTVWTTKK